MKPSKNLANEFQSGEFGSGLAIRFFIKLWGGGEGSGDDLNLFGGRGVIGFCM